jgi:hypothetical protein
MKSGGPSEHGNVEPDVTDAALQLQCWKSRSKHMSSQNKHFFAVKVNAMAIMTLLWSSTDCVGQDIYQSPENYDVMPYETVCIKKRSHGTIRIQWVQYSFTVGGVFPWFIGCRIILHPVGARHTCGGGQGRRVSGRTVQDVCPETKLLADVLEPF